LRWREYYHHQRLRLSDLQLFVPFVVVVVVETKKEGRPMLIHSLVIPLTGPTALKRSRLI
jgi:hypothetical protein